MDKILFIKQIEQWPQKSEQWLNQRKHKLTSSDAATAIGINPYEKPVNLLFKKCGLGPGFTGNAATKHGEKYESEAIDLYCKLMNKKNYEFGLISYETIDKVRRPSKLDDIGFDLSFLAGSPDGVSIDNDNSEELILLEVKCPARRKIKFGYCPEYYYPQVQLNMAILDLYKADFIEYLPACMSPTGRLILNIVRIHRDNDWLYDNIIVLNDFWKSVVHWRTTGIEGHPMYEQFTKVKVPRAPKAGPVWTPGSATAALEFRNEDDVPDEELVSYIGIEFRDT
jgi:putative phage-type endonuclease